LAVESPPLLKPNLNTQAKETPFSLGFARAYREETSFRQKFNSEGDYAH
jgi:hypothetical protein